MVRNVDTEILVTADNERLTELTNSMIRNYLGIRGHLHVWWVNEDPMSLQRIVAIDLGIDHIPPIAVSNCTQNKEHFILLNEKYWSQAEDRELTGVLAHELAHEEWKALGYASIMPPPIEGLPLICNERITDLIAIYKGYGPELLASRLYMEREKAHTWLDYLAFSPAEIGMILNLDRKLSPISLDEKPEDKAFRHNELGAVLFEYNKHIEASDEFRKAILCDPTKAIYHFNLGNTFLKLGEFDNAIESYLIAVTIEASDPKIHFALGQAYRMQGKFEQAHKAFETADFINPNQTEYRTALVQAQIELSKSSKRRTSRKVTKKRRRN